MEAHAREPSRRYAFALPPVGFFTLPRLSLRPLVGDAAPFLLFKSAFFCPEAL